MSKSPKPVHPSKLEMKPEIGPCNVCEPELHNSRNEAAREWADSFIPYLTGDFGDEVRQLGGAIAGEFPLWDKKAWGRLITEVGRCRCHKAGMTAEEQGPCPLYEYVLVGHESEDVTVFYSTVIHEEKKI